MFPHPLERLLRAPSLLWFSTSSTMITALAWAGLAAAVGLIANVWPRLMLFACWLILLSYVSAWGIFSSSIVDKLMLEIALLLIPFAPAGLLPGLGAASPPRRIAVFMVRFLLLRVMFEAGIIKLMVGDSHWRDLTAMEVMYETSPLPTIFGFLDHQLPHAYHVFEILLTFTAEIIGPVLAVFGSRNWRWFALAAWTMFQGGIELTTSFGWLNTTAIAAGLILLDDQMLEQAASVLRLRRLAAVFSAARGRQGPRPPVRWHTQLLRAALCLHVALSVYFFVQAGRGRTVLGVPSPRSDPVEFVFRDFESANPWIPYISFPLAKYEVEFMGSNDGGKTWRSYEFKYKPQHTDRICRHVAPWFDRFEASLQLCVNVPNTTVIPRVAALLMLRNPDVMALFDGDPFGDKPPNLIRMPVYRYHFTSWATMRATGNYWTKEFVGDYAMPMRINERGHLVQDR